MSRDSRSTLGPLVVCTTLAFLGLVVTGDRAVANGLSVEKVQRVRIGGYAEGVTFVRNGPLAGEIAFVDGHEVWGVPARGHENQKARVLFSLTGLSLQGRVQGISYVDSRKLFLVNDDSQKDKLFWVDHQGRPKGILNLQYVGSYFPFHLEGLAYVPSGSILFPDHIVMAVWDPPDASTSRVLVINPQGQVVHQIISSAADGFSGCVPSQGTLAGVTWLPGDLLLLGSGDELCTIEFDGDPVGVPVPDNSPNGFGEGAARLPDGNLVVLGYPQRLLFFDSNLNRLPEKDRNDVVGLGLGMPQGVAWNSATNRHLVKHAPVGFAVQSLVSAIPRSLDTATTVIDLAAAGYPAVRPLEYLADENLLAGGHRGRGGPPASTLRFRGLVLFDNAGVLVPPPLPSPPDGTKRPATLAYVPGQSPGSGTFVVGFEGEPTKLYFLERMGSVVGAPLDLATTTALTGINAVAYFNAGSGGRLLIFGSPDTSRAVITDLTGAKIAEFNYRKALDLVAASDLATVRARPGESRFSVVSALSGELIVFEVE